MGDVDLGLCRQALCVSVQVSETARHVDHGPRLLGCEDPLHLVWALSGNYDLSSRTFDARLLVWQVRLVVLRQLYNAPSHAGRAPARPRADDDARIARMSDKGAAACENDDGSGGAAATGVTRRHPIISAARCHGIYMLHGQILQYAVSLHECVARRLLPFHRRLGCILWIWVPNCRRSQGSGGVGPDEVSQQQLRQHLVADFRSEVAVLAVAVEDTEEFHGAATQDGTYGAILIR